MAETNSNKDSSPVRPNKSEALPNLYGWLRIAPMESQRAEIEQAIARFQHKFLSEPLRDSVETRRARKIIELAENHLLNEQLKQIYDRKWKQHFAVKADPAVEAPQPMPAAQEEIRSIADQTTFDSFLPTNDPDLPFDLPAYLNSITEMNSPNPELEFQKLQRLLVESRLEESVASRLPVLPPQSAKKRYKKNSHVFGAVALIVGVGLVLALGFLLLRNPIGPPATDLFVASSLSEHATSTLGNNASIDSGSRSGSSLNSPTPQVGSGLPKPGEGTVQGFGVDLNAKEPVENGKKAEPPPQPANTTEANLPTAPNAVNTPTGDALTPSVPVKSDTARLPSPAIVERSATGLAEPKLSPGDRESWTKAMLSAKKQIGDQAFESVDKKLAELAAKAKTGVQKDQHQRLTTINKLAQEFNTALREAITGLSAGEVVKVGTSTQASFVAGSTTTITVRVTGENRRYSLDQIPMGLAYALADLKLDVAHPSTLARKSAFALVHPKSNQAFLEKGRQLMLEAAQAEIVPGDLVQAFDDTYELDD